MIGVVLGVCVAQLVGKTATLGFAAALSTMTPAVLIQLNFKGTTLPRLKVGVVCGVAGYGDSNPLNELVGFDCGLTIATAHVEKCPTTLEKRTIAGVPVVG